MSYMNICDHVHTSESDEPARNMGEMEKFSECFFNYLQISKFSAFHYYQSRTHKREFRIAHEI